MAKTYTIVSTRSRNAAQLKLDVHMKDVDQRHKELLDRYK